MSITRCRHGLQPLGHHQDHLRLGPHQGLAGDRRERLVRSGHLARVGEGGTFAVELTVDAKDDYTDCFESTCVLATRNDHTLSGVRSQDAKVDDDTGGTGGNGSTGVTVLPVAVLAAAGWAAYRRGRTVT